MWRLFLLVFSIHLLHLKNKVHIYIHIVKEFTINHSFIYSFIPLWVIPLHAVSFPTSLEAPVSNIFFIPITMGCGLFSYLHQSMHTCKDTFLQDCVWFMWNRKVNTGTTKFFDIFKCWTECSIFTAVSI